MQIWWSGFSLLLVDLFLSNINCRIDWHFPFSNSGWGTLFCSFPSFFQATSVWRIPVGSSAFYTVRLQYRSFLSSSMGQLLWFYFLSTWSWWYHLHQMENVKNVTIENCNHLVVDNHFLPLFLYLKTQMSTVVANEISLFFSLSL